MASMEHLSDEMLAAAVEGRLTPQERRQVLRHLAACPQCTAAWAALHGMLQRAEALPPIPLEHPLEQALGWLRAIAPLPVWAWHLLLFGLVPLVWLAAVDGEMLPKLGVFRYTLQAWPAAWLMTTHFLWLQPRLRELMASLWEAGLPLEQVEAFQRRHLAILQGRGVGGIWFFLGLALAASLGNWWLAPPAQVWEGLKAYGIGLYALWVTAAMYWGWLWGGRLWWGMGRLVQEVPWLKAHPILARGRRLAAGWVVVAGVSMLWHLLMTPGAPEVHRAVQAWGSLVSLVLLMLWGGYAALEWQVAPRPLRQRGNGWLAVRLALTLALVALTLPALR